MQKKRKFNKIEYSSETRQSNIGKKKGSEQQTASLNINLKTINKNYLNQFLEKCINEQERAIINQYILRDKANFKSTRTLFGVVDQGEEHQHQTKSHEHIRQYMVQKYSQTEFLKRVFCNEKMDFKSKLIFIKYLEKVRRSAIVPISHSFWKERF